MIAELGDHNHTVVHGKAMMETVRQAMKQLASDTEETTRQIVQGAMVNVSLTSVHFYPSNAMLSRDELRQGQHSLLSNRKRMPCTIYGHN